MLRDVKSLVTCLCRKRWSLSDVRMTSRQMASVSTAVESLTETSAENHCHIMQCAHLNEAPSPVLMR